MPHLDFKSESGLSKFLRRDLSRPLGRPENDGSDPAAIFEQTPLFLRLKPYIGETGEMQHRPEAIGSIREIVARDGGARSRIETAENHVQTRSEDPLHSSSNKSAHRLLCRRAHPLSPVGCAPWSAVSEHSMCSNSGLIRWLAAMAGAALASAEARTNRLASPPV
jgi:hypothetical protein